MLDMKIIRKYFKDMFDNFMFMIFKKIQIKEIYKENDKIYFKGIHIQTRKAVDKIKYSSVFLGNGKGFIRYPEINDFVLVLNFFGEHFIIGFIYDDFTEYPDKQVENYGELLIANKDWGAYVKFDKEDNIIIKTRDGAKYKLLKDGRFKLFDKNNYGIESDGNGNITIYGDLTIKGNINTIKYMDNNGTSDIERTAYSGNTKQQGQF